MGAAGELRRYARPPACRRRRWQGGPATGDQAPLAARRVTDARPTRACQPATAAFAALPPPPTTSPGRPGPPRGREGLTGGRWPVFARERHDVASAPDWFWTQAPPAGAGPDRFHDTPATRPSGTSAAWGVPPPPPGRPPTAPPAARSGARTPMPNAPGGLMNPFLSGIHWTSGPELGGCCLGVDPPAAGRRGPGRCSRATAPSSSSSTTTRMARTAAKPRVVGQQPLACRDGRAVRRELRVHGSRRCRLARGAATVLRRELAKRTLPTA
jgi:hypothetical protein